MKGKHQGVSTRKVPNREAGGGIDSKGQSDRKRRRKKEGEGKDGYIPGYTSTPEDIRLLEVYGDWVHNNYCGHVYLEAGTRRAGVEELAMILPPWSIKRERIGSRWMWF